MSRDRMNMDFLFDRSPDIPGRFCQAIYWHYYPPKLLFCKKENLMVINPFDKSTTPPKQAMLAIGGACSRVRTGCRFFQYTPYKKVKKIFEERLKKKQCM